MVTVDGHVDTKTRNRLECGRFGDRMARHVGALHHRLRERVFAVQLGGCSQANEAVSRRRLARKSGIDDDHVVTAGSPRVSVPVLSKTTVVKRKACSRYSAPRMRMPDSAPFPTPTISAAGVAIPSAQGHAMMSTAMKASTARGMSPAIHHATRLPKAMTTTAGTKCAVTRSAIRWIYAEELCACSTSAMIWLSTVSRPTALL